MVGTDTFVKKSENDSKDTSEKEIKSEDISTESEADSSTPTETPAVKPPPKKKKKNMYFDNPKVEGLLNRYVIRGCVDIELRDEIMSHADELIRQIIRAHNFEHIFPSRDQSSFFELSQVAWMQIEKTLYKYNNTPGSPKVFNMWSQVAKTRILAYIKKEKRDKKNMPSYKDYIIRRHKTKSRSIEDFEKFLEELGSFCEYDEDFAQLSVVMKSLWLSDEKPYDGFKAKLQKASNMDMSTITQFIKLIRLHRDEFSVNIFDIRDFDYKEKDAYFYNDHDE